MNGLKRRDPDGNKQTDAATHAVWSSVIEPKIDFERSLIVLQVGARLLLSWNSRLLAGHKAFSGRRENEFFGLNSADAYIRLQDRWIYTVVCRRQPLLRLA